MRYHSKEHQDNESKYAYDFDYVLRNYMLKAFEPFINPYSKALEMGCYKGEFTKLLEKYYTDLTAIDAVSAAIDEARTKTNNVKFVASTFEEYEPNEKFDNIYFMHALEHLDKPVQILKKTKTWLSETGKLFLVVPNANAISRQLAVKMELITHNNAVTSTEFEHGHRRTYSFDTLEHHALASGLTVIYRTGIFLKPFANFQFDMLLNNNIINQKYLDACFELGFLYPNLCASIFLLCQ